MTGKLQILSFRVTRILSINNMSDTLLSYRENFYHGLYNYFDTFNVIGVLVSIMNLNFPLVIISFKMIKLLVNSSTQEIIVLTSQLSTSVFYFLFLLFCR